MGADDSLEQLMARYLAGDMAAFDELYARVSPRVFGYLLSMTGTRARAEDLFQTTFLKLHRGRSGWIPGAPVLPWLMAIARNAFYDDARTAKQSRVRLTATGEVPDLIPPGDLEAELTREDAERSSAAVLEALAPAVASLPPLQREAFALTKQGGLTHKEAAISLGTTETAVKLRVHRAYEALRVALRQHREREP
jgi:RNA polymerase sigma-70 factor, ECF subfamily